MSEKTPIYIFSTFGSKINEFERKKIGKNQKKEFKTDKNEELSQYFEEKQELCLYIAQKKG